MPQCVRALFLSRCYSRASTDWVFIVPVCLCLLLGGVSVAAQGEQSPAWLNETVLKALFPAAIYTGAIEGNPPVAEVYGTGRKIGYLFATSDLVDAVGFSGAPFTFAVGLDLDGEIVGIELVEHSEPIIDYNALSEPLRHFIGQYVGLEFGSAIGISGGGQKGHIDGISSATVSARSFHHAIIQSARMVARSRGLRTGDGSAAAVDTLHFEPLTWTELVDSGAVRRLVVRGKDVGRMGDEDLVIDLHVALLTPAVDWSESSRRDALRQPRVYLQSAGSRSAAHGQRTLFFRR